MLIQLTERVLARKLPHQPWRGSTDARRQPRHFRLGLRQPTLVRISVNGDGGWRDLPNWPPPSVATVLHPGAAASLRRRAGLHRDRSRRGEVVGTPYVELDHTADPHWADVFVRISDVDGEGRSHHVAVNHWRRAPSAPINYVVGLGEATRLYCR